jgi:hypothetical protein
MRKIQFVVVDMPTRISTVRKRVKKPNVRAGPLARTASASSKKGNKEKVRLFI